MAVHCWWIYQNWYRKLIQKMEQRFKIVLSINKVEDCKWTVTFSGLLVTLIYFRTESKKQVSEKSKNAYKDIQASTVQFSIMLLYRVLRLTPAYLFVLGLNEIILRYIHNNSVFTPAMIDHITCDKFWWRNALYINNFYPRDEFCMLWSWYMANDTQFYILACILLLIAIR